MALLTAAIDWLLTELEAADVGRVTTDPRDVAPPCVLVEPPSIVSLNGDVAELDVPVSILGTPPVSAQTISDLLTRADSILARKDVRFTTGRPQTYTLGNQDLPCFTLTARVTYAAD